MNREMSKIERGVAIGVFGMLFMLLVRRIIDTVRFFDGTDIYGFWGISEYMINYQGGFVRRGVVGELLYQIFKIHPYNFPVAILWIDIVALAVLLTIAFYVFYKKHWIAILPLTIIYNNIIWYRRDFMMMIVAFAIFYFLFQYFYKKRLISIVCFILLSSVSILTYEPSFFFFAPISMFLFWNCSFGNPLRYRILNLLKVFALPLLCMITVCTAKGSEEIANAIWNSWQPMFDYHGVSPTKIGCGIEFLGRPTSQLIEMHLNFNYGIGIGERFGFKPLLVIGAILMFIGTYYLITQTPSIKRTKRDCIMLSDMFIFQFICLLPMFTILSCDFGRTINYLIYTTYFLVYFLSKYKVQYTLPIIHNVSANVYAFCNNAVMLSLWFYIIVLMLMPFEMDCGVSVLNPLGHEYIYIILNKIQSLLTIIGL